MRCRTNNPGQHPPPCQASLNYLLAADTCCRLQSIAIRATVSVDVRSSTEQLPNDPFAASGCCCLQSASVLAVLSSDVCPSCKQEVNHLLKTPAHGHLQNTSLFAATSIYICS